MDWREDFSTYDHSGELDVWPKLQQMQKEWGTDPTNGTRNAFASLYFLMLMMSDNVCPRAQILIQKELENSIRRMLTVQQLRDLNELLAMVIELDDRVRVAQEFEAPSDPVPIAAAMKDLLRRLTTEG